jgi:hypothetical protein
MGLVSGQIPLRRTLPRGGILSEDSFDFPKLIPGILTDVNGSFLAIVMLCQAEWIPCKHPFLNGLTGDKVFLNKSRDSAGSHAVVPRPFRVDNHRRALAADAQTADFTAVAGVGAASELAVFDLTLEHFPGGRTFLRRAAFRAGAQQNMTSVGADTNLRRCHPQLFLEL